MRVNDRQWVCPADPKRNDGRMEAVLAASQGLRPSDPCLWRRVRVPSPEGRPAG
jgi:hypothetical protein